MAVPGRVWEAVSIPRWLMVAAAFVLGTLGTGFAFGRFYSGTTAATATTLSEMQKTDTLTIKMHQALELRVTAVEAVVPLIRGMARLSCSKMTPADELIAQLPCADLLRDVQAVGGR